MSLHPNFTTFLIYDKNYFNSTQNITFTSEEQVFLKEFNDEEPQVQPKPVQQDLQSSIEDELKDLIVNDFWLFGMAVTRPYVYTYIGIGFGSTTVFLLLMICLFSGCCRKSLEEEEEQPKFSQKRKQH
jgi:hypothetical protein